jgi:5-methylcytosine-specific restriction endonuclease McrA
MEIKFCIQCHQSKFKSEFYKKASRCIPCVLINRAEYRKNHAEEIRLSKKQSYQNNLAKNKAKSAAYYLVNQEKKKARQSEYRNADKERNKRQKAEYYLRHKEYVKSKRVKWYNANKDKVREWYKVYNQTPKGRAVIVQGRAKRRALLKGCEAIDCTALITEWRSKIVKCYLCGKTLAGNKCHIDHIIPLSKGGKHEPKNIAPTCPFCNMSKGSKLVKIQADLING